MSHKASGERVSKGQSECLEMKRQSVSLLVKRSVERTQPMLTELFAHRSGTRDENGFVVTQCVSNTNKFQTFACRLITEAKNSVTIE